MEKKQKQLALQKSQSHGTYWRTSDGKYVFHLLSYPQKPDFKPMNAPGKWTTSANYYKGGWLYYFDSAPPGVSKWNDAAADSSQF